MIRFAASTAGILALLITATTPAIAQATDYQVVEFEVPPISYFEVSDNNVGPLYLVASGPGTFDPGFDNSTTYTVTTTGENMKITADLDQDMPAGLSLTVEFEAPTGATSEGEVELSNTEVDLVTGIDGANASGLTITYRLTATGSPAVMTESRTVTFTVTEGA